MIDAASKKKKGAAKAPEPEWEEAGMCHDPSYPPLTYLRSVSFSAAPKKKDKKEKKKGPANPKSKKERYPGAPAYRRVVLNKKQNKLKAKLIAFFEQYNADKVPEFENGDNDDLVQHYSLTKNIDGMAHLNEALRVSWQINSYIDGSRYG